nr:ribonuclease H-like domain-containing protein [Tanacetum cinerariifolium]
MTDYSLWEVILNGDSPIPTRVIDGIVQPVAPTTGEQRLARKNELKARGTLLMALPDKNQLKFNIHKDAKTLMEAIEKRFYGNKETKKASKAYQPIRNSGSKTDLEDQSLDDLFNSLKIYEAEVKSSSSTSPTTQNIAFVSSQNTDSTNESVSDVASVSAASTKVHVSTLPNMDTLGDVVIYSFFASQSNSPQLDNDDLKQIDSNSPQLDNDDLKQIDGDELEEMDLKWHMAMLTIRARRFLQRTGRNLGANGTTSIGFDMSKVECHNCHRRRHFTRECISPKDTKNKEVQRRNVPVETSTSNALVLQCDGVGSYDWSFQAEEEPTNYALMEFTFLSSSSSDNENLSQLLASQTSDKTGLGYDNQVINSTVFSCDEMFSSESNVRTFMPPKPDLVFHDAPTVNDIVPTAFNVEPNTTKPNKDLSQLNRPSAAIIEDWVFDSEDNSEGEPMPTQKASSFVQTTEHVKTSRPSVKLVEHPIPAENLRKDIPKFRGHRHSRIRKACFVCKSLTHLIKDCDYYEKKMVQKPVRNHAMRGHHQHYARMTHPNPQRHVIPTAVLTRSRLVLLNAARLVNTDVPQTKVQHQRPTPYGVHKPHSPLRRPINRRLSSSASNFQQKVTTAKTPHVNAVQGVKGNWGNLQHALKDKGVIDNGCLRHMTGNMSYLSDFEEINGGYVAFGENPNGGKITCKGKIRTGKLDFNDVYFVKELKFRLLSVSQMCDKKNSILFTDTECIVLSSDFKLPDENHVLLRVPRENNMYNVDLKNIIPSGDLTCLFAKATLDESNLWHRRLGHINFKIINKLVKGNLVRGLPSKVFKNNHTCVASKKGKQHRAFCKTKPVSSISQPLQRKNMTLNKAARTMLADSLLLIPFWAEAVNTACYVQNRVLVTKPHNKTPYELLLGRTPNTGFMRPFGFLVTIFNTLNPLCKFDGNANEGFLVGYSVSSKAFRVFNSRTRIVQETLHINFLENKPNVVGSGPTWLFDIDTLAKSMNYQAVLTGNQPNPSADPHNTDDDTTFEVKEPESEVHVSPSSSAKRKKHDDKTKRKAKGKNHVELSTGIRNLSKEFEDFSDNSINEVNAASTPVPAVGQISTNSTNTFSAAGPSKEELLQFKMEKVWVLVDLPKGKRAIGSKWVFRNKKMDVKSAFLYGTIKEEIYVCQPLGFKDLDYLDKVYKVVKALYGLHQAPRAWCETLANYLLENDFQREKIDQTLFIKKQKGLQVKQKQDEIFINQDKYVAETLRNFGLTYGKSASTPIDTEKPFIRILMVRMWMYIPTVTPKASHLHAVKKIFRYLKGKPHLGLWYPKDSPFNLVAYSDSDYAGASLDRKSTTGGYQFLDASEGFEQILDFLNASVIQYALTVNPTIYVSCIKQFWSSVSIKKTNDVVRLQGLIDRRKVIITEDTVRQALRLDDAESIDCLSNAKIFAELERMGVLYPFTERHAQPYFFHVLIRQGSRCVFPTFPIVLRPFKTLCFFNYALILRQDYDITSSLQRGALHLSSYATKYTSLALTQKVFANKRRVGKGFSGVDTSLFEGVLVPHQAHDEVADDVAADDVADVATVDVADEVVDVVAEDAAEPTPPSPIPSITQPPPQHEVTSTPPPSPHQSPIAQPSSPPP